MGVLIDLEKMTAEVPQDKVLRTCAAIDAALDVRWVGADAIQSLLGLLGFCGQVLVVGGWRVPWTVLALRVAVRQGFAPMNSFWESELRWWLELLRGWKGPMVVLMVAVDWLIPTHSADGGFFTDASRELSTGTGGAGAIFGKLAMQFDFTQSEITHLEICDTEGLVLVLWLTMLLGIPETRDKIVGRRFVTWCDNQSFQGAVNAHKSNAPTLAFLLGILHNLQARYSFDLVVKYVKSEDNVAADAASRRDFERFYAFMLSLGVSSADIVWLPVQETLRSSWSSELKSMRIAQHAMKEKQNRE
jgi:hypothetical protein